MAKIQVLDQKTINQIAAGEVVERPQAVVKELVENSIDANANAVTVEIKSGGIDFIRVTDNGFGINKEDIPNMFLRHSTSKIKTALDLINISSLGFRGEALSSIASVAQVELITKTPDSLTGIRYQIAGGTSEKPEEIGCPNGTTLIVRNLFYNTPARKKFLKSSITEAGYISDLMNRLAASHPNVSFKFINNNKVRLHTSGNGNIKDIIYNIYGRDIAFNLIPIEAETNSIEIKGFIGNPKISRGNRSYENYFLNGRYIKSSIITKAIEEAYKPFTMNHKYPFTSLHIQIDPTLVDVNVHPTKLEVRFNNGNEIYDLVYNGVRGGLYNKELISQVELVKEKEVSPPVTKVAEPFEEKRREEELRKEVTEGIDSRKEERTNNILKETGNTKENNTLSTGYSYKRPSTDSLPNKGEDISHEEKQKIKEQISDTEIGKLNEVVEDPSSIIRQEVEQLSFLSEESIKEHRIIGQAFATYWIIEFDEKLYIIDQHAAHEKVLYERVMKDFKSKNITSQNLNPPIVLTFSMREQEILGNYNEEFKELGFEIEEFGGNEYAIRAIPSDLDGLAQKDIFIELIDNLSEENYNRDPDILIDKIATISCKAAVKGNQKLSAREVHELIGSLLKLENPYYCPHGRPTMISLSKYELEKRFKRVL